MEEAIISISFLLIIAFFVVVYFLPFIIALIRNIKEKTLVFFLNLFFGWTFIGFFILVLYASLTSVTLNETAPDFVNRKKSKKKIKKN